MTTYIPPCPICQNSRTRLYCTKDNYPVAQCQVCEGGFLIYDPAQLNLDALYQDYYNLDIPSDERHGYDNYFTLEKSITVTSKKRINIIKKHLPAKEGLALLDIGCGPGFFLKEASKNFQVTGIEPSQSAVNYAKKNLFLNVSQGILKKGLFSPNAFDIVTLWDVIEHVPAPNAYFKEINTIVKPGGIVALSTGDMTSLAAKLSGVKWHLLTLPEHLFFFSPKSITELIEKNGFKILQISYPFDYYTVDYLFERITKSLRFGMGYRNNQPVRAFFNNFMLPVSLFDIMFVVAQKI